MCRTKQAPPKVRAYRDYIVNQCDTLPRLWQSTNPKHRSLALYLLDWEEPRYWKWPLSVVRDEIVLPEIERTHGSDVARTLSGTALLDDYVQLACREVDRRVPAYKRRPRERDLSDVERLIKLAERRRGYDASRTENWNCTRAGKHLGYGRAPDYGRSGLRKTVEDHLTRMGCVDEKTRLLVNRAIDATAVLMDECDAVHPFVRNEHSRLSVATNRVTRDSLAVPTPSPTEFDHDNRKSKKSA
jgi:hypothetical protein